MRLSVIVPYVIWASSLPTLRYSREAREFLSVHPDDVDMTSGAMLILIGKGRKPREESREQFLSARKPGKHEGHNSEIETWRPAVGYRQQLMMFPSDTLVKDFSPIRSNHLFISTLSIMDP